MSEDDDQQAVLFKKELEERWASIEEYKKKEEDLK